MNALGYAILNSFESCRLQAYQDENGVWSIGWGDTFGVHPGMVITQEEADSRREGRVSTSEALVKHYCGYPLNENQLSALVDFAYNEGIGRFRTSELCAKLRNGDTRVQQEFLNWTKVAGKTGVLSARRECEWALFSGDLATLGRLLAVRGTPLKPGMI